MYKRLYCFQRTFCFNERLDHVLEFKVEAKGIHYAIVNFIVYLITRNGSGFGSYFVLNILPQW